ncbi:hypothetical protein MAHJHV57_49780 [Mycobacterium avium subsp. hominissuis]
MKRHSEIGDRRALLLMHGAPDGARLGRRDLSVLLLLDVSGSAAEPGTVGRTVHEQHR